MWPGNNVHKLHNREKQGVFLFQLCFWAAMLFLSLVLTRDSVLIRTCWSLSGIWTHQTWRRRVRSAASTLSSGWTLSLQTGGRRSRSDGGAERRPSLSRSAGTWTCSLMTFPPAGKHVYLKWAEICGWSEASFHSIQRGPLCKCDRAEISSSAGSATKCLSHQEEVGGR